MIKSLIFFIILLPVASFAQISITGKVINKAGSQPVADASVFLSNSSVGAKTAKDGVFILNNVKPGRYDLVVSIVGFETYSQTITAGKNNIKLPDISLVPKTIALKQVTIKYHADPDRERYLIWFRDEFLGVSKLAWECKMVNPEVLDLTYDEATNTLRASSYDFLIIENDALGYRIKYLVTDFSMQNKSGEKKVFYKGPVLFEELKGSTSQKRRWRQNREQVYENSPMHFLRAALNNRITDEGFRAQKEISYDNPDRPSDSLINAKIAFFKKAKLVNHYLNDPEAVWTNIAKLPKKLQKTITLTKEDLVKPTNQPGMYAFTGDTNKMFIAYSKDHRYHIKNNINYLYNANNNENTLIKFNSPAAFFYSNGVIINPYSVMYFGVWGRDRVAELLPINYEPPQGEVVADEMVADNIQTKIDSFVVHHAAERAYLQFDKPYYAAGDTIYFKAYVTAGGDHRLSDLSGVLHAELINAKGLVDQSIKLQLNGGVAWGDFALPDSLPAGNYRVVAYTRWMRNEGDDAFFDRTIAVGSLLRARIPESGLPVPKVNQSTDIQFFPEGGGLTVAVTAKVAFKAIGPDGLGTEINGVVTDNDHQEVARFATVHLGMGSFSFRPEVGKTYTANVTYPNGSSSVIMLPQASEKGITLSVNNDSIPKAVVRITAGKTCYQENKNKVYSLLIWSGENVITVPCTLDSTTITLDILKRRLKTGITTLTLFSPAGEPLCERLIFVQNHDQLSLNITSDKTTYGKREKVTLALNTKTRADSAAMGHFSVSVTDESKVTVDENSEGSILASLLLTADLKGYIEKPNYYFNNVNDKVTSDLDLVMLTHGYRRFAWKQILNDQDKTLAYKPEKGFEISGIAKNALGKPLAAGTVTLVPPAGGPLLSRQTDDKGNFSFDNLAFTDSAKFILQAVTAKGKNSTTLVYNREKEIPSPPSILPTADTSAQPKLTYLENSLKQHDQAVQYGTATGRMLKEVKIQNTKIEVPKIDNRYGIADQVIDGDKILYGGSLAIRLMGLIHGVHFIPAGGNRFRPVLNRPAVKPMLIVWNGNEMPQSFDLSAINTSSIESIEVITDPTATSSTYDGVIIVNTTFGLRLKDISSTGILLINVAGFYKAREFYAPRYEHADNLNRPDLRSTIYWKPELQTDKDGKASFDFFNADGAGTYKVVIEGIDDKGNLGRRIYRYEVE